MIPMARIALTERGKEIRRKTIDLSMANGGYHYGGSFSAVEILITLYDKILKPEDRFILSKGHSCWPLYALLQERGMSPKLGGHPERDPSNGIHATTGSLGHGLPFGIGLAAAKRMQKEPGRIFVLMGDGECQEGTTWESLLIAGHLHLGNLFVIIDHNGIQGSGHTDDILPIRGLGGTAMALGWNVGVCDGHDMDAILCGLVPPEPGWPPKPRLLIANTIKGRGVSFMEDKPEWHAKYPDKEQLEWMREELR